ncbi:hypothetical protein N7468_004760 [Penicillium chermesinum]|uniref:Uncharacterized protein n=1 Tax=Penicillium chermesinum TaxID=63820 RepID=A0A9W9TSW1_9EURO|nr:uncharacterized protein N7468_004760 [Penicillium chermesinum]KAJ5240141.1 hypothetical protein N7468_004760 [Penicillium chermesinum]KAJ6167016.1 hypothetical protein N7470_002463 [Penicillium chermesinum]
MHPFSVLTLGIFVAGYTTARWDLVTRLYELAIFAWVHGVVRCRSPAESPPLSNYLLFHPLKLLTLNFSKDADSLGFPISVDLFLPSCGSYIPPRLERERIGEQSPVTSGAAKQIDYCYLDTKKYKCANKTGVTASSPRESRRLRARTAAPPRIVLELSGG